MGFLFEDVFSIDHRSKKNRINQLWKIGVGGVEHGTNSEENLVLIVT